MTEIMSIRDAIMGLAMRAGSIPSFLASMGSIPPMVFANIIITSIAPHTVRAMAALSPSNSIILMKLSVLRPAPIKKLLHSSFHNIRQASLGKMSPTAIPRITRVAD